MTLLQAALVAAGYWFSNSAFNANLGFNLLRWPLVAGTLVGWLMGDLNKGIVIGASINLVFLGTIWAGASQPSDPALAGWLGTGIALSANLDPVEAVAFGALLGFLPLLAVFNRMRVDVGFARRAAAAAARGEAGGVAYWNVVPPQAYLFVTTFPPAFVLALLGAAAVGALYALVDPARGGLADWRWVRDAIILAGSLLTALGVALNLNLLLTRPMAPYFLLFFALAAVSQAHIVVLALPAALLALAHVIRVRRTVHA